VTDWTRPAFCDL